MALISPNLPSDGEVASAASVNNPFNAIISEINGNLDSNNLANDAVTNSKLANNSVSSAKLQEGAVTPEKISVASTIFVHTFTNNTGTQTITHPSMPFKPKWIKVSVTQSNSSNVYEGVGYARDDDGTIVQGVKNAATDGTASNTQTGWQDTAAIRTMDSDGTNNFRAIVTGMAEGEITVNVTTSNSFSGPRRYLIEAHAV